MNRLLKSFRELDTFLKWQLVIGLITSFTWSLCIPIMHKLQGLYWSTTYISVYLACDRMSGLFIPLFRGGNIRNLFLLNMALNSIYAMSLFLYFCDVHVFLIAEVVIGMCFGITAPLWRISYDLHVVRNYPNSTYEDFLYLDRFRTSLGGVLGSAFVAAISSVCDFDQTVKSFMFSMVLMLVLGGVNWKLFYRDIKTHSEGALTVG